MRFDAYLSISALSCILAVAATAATARSVFDANREAILSSKTFTADEYVFAVGRATSAQGHGDAVGFAKADTLAYGILDRINFMQAEWPADLKPEERALVWELYRERRPFRVRTEGVQRVFSRKNEQNGFLSVLALPRGGFPVETVTAADLAPAVARYRSELKVAEESIRQAAAAASAKTNSVPAAGAGNAGAGNATR